MHETDYRVSARAALEELQDRIFEEGEYSKPWEGRAEIHAQHLADAFEAMDLLNDLLVEMEESGKADTFERLKSGAAPRDRVEAVLWSGRGGTGSVLDVDELEPMLRTEIAERFGSWNPEVKLVREQVAILHEVARPVARFLVAYEGGLPAALFFFGSEAG